MKVHCPHCLEEMELPPDGAPEVECTYCRARFDVREKETIPAGERPELYPGIRAGDRFGPYVIERRLGKGGMGAVFEAEQTTLGRSVALKVLSRDLTDSDEFIERFEREARALASLSHPNIVSVIDRGEERGIYYLVMERVDGVSLRELMDEGPIPTTDALRLVPQICDALEYAHARGVVHRDIKPENILVDRDGRVQIADFGLARLLDEDEEGQERITRTHMVMGSVDYMAPEQRERVKEVDHRADIYSLGVVLYELLTGELPIGRFEPPSRKIGISVEMDEVILKVLDKDPERRYQQASEVKTDVERCSDESGAPSPRPAGSATDDAPETWDEAFSRIATVVAYPATVIIGLGLFASLFGAMSMGGVALLAGMLAGLAMPQLLDLWPPPSEREWWQEHPWFACTLAIWVVGIAGDATGLYGLGFGIVAWAKSRHEDVEPTPAPAGSGEAAPDGSPADAEAEESETTVEAGPPERRTSLMAVGLFCVSILLFLLGVGGVLACVGLNTNALWELVAVQSRTLPEGANLGHFLTEGELPGLRMGAILGIVGLLTAGVILLVLDLVAFVRAGGRRKGRLLVVLALCLQVVFLLPWLAASGRTVEAVEWWDRETQDVAAIRAEEDPGEAAADARNQAADLARDVRTADRPPWRRVLAARLLGELPPLEACPEILGVLETADPVVRAVAIVSLGRSLDRLDDRIEEAFDGLDDPMSVPFGEVERSMVGAGELRTEADRALRTALASENAAVRWAACRALALAGRTREVAWPVLDGLDPGPELKRLKETARRHAANPELVAMIRRKVLAMTTEGEGCALTADAPELGLREGDVVLSLDGRPTPNVFALRVAVERAGDEITLRVRRDGEIRQLAVEGSALAIPGRARTLERSGASPGSPSAPEDPSPEDADLEPDASVPVEAPSGT